MQRYQKEEPFELPVAYHGQELLLPARLIQIGYTYKIYIAVEGQEIIFEPDEERNFRAMIEHEAGRKISMELVHAIAEALEKNLR